MWFRWFQGKGFLRFERPFDTDLQPLFAIRDETHNYSTKIFQKTTESKRLLVRNVDFTKKKLAPTPWGLGVGDLRRITTWDYLNPHFITYSSREMWNLWEPSLFGEFRPIAWLLCRTGLRMFCSVPVLSNQNGLKRIKCFPWSTVKFCASSSQIFTIIVMKKLG